VARFPLSISRTEMNGEESVRKSALINCECWRKQADADTFELLKKGQLVQLSGYIRPEEWIDEDGTKHSRIVFVATSVSEVKASEVPEEKKAPKGKSRTKAA
jgi:single-strand DNA-binding protein